MLKEYFWRGATCAKCTGNGWLFGLTNIPADMLFCLQNHNFMHNRKQPTNPLDLLIRQVVLEMSSLTQITFFLPWDGGKQKLFSADKHALRNSHVKRENCRIVLIPQENPHLKLNRIECHYYYYAPSWFAWLSLQYNLETLPSTETNDYVASVRTPEL